MKVLKVKKTPKIKISDADKNKVEEHIKSFQTIESHYCRKDSTKAYLEGMLNLRKNVWALHTAVHWVENNTSERKHAK